MAEPLSIASGLIGIIVATAQSTKTLYQTVQSFRDQPRAVRQLQDELKSLDGVLDSLHDAVEEEATFFQSLQLPLRQCGDACSEFRSLIVKCTTHSDGARPSVRDWVRLRYMDTDIRGFTEMLAGYKSTMSVALADANLRSSKITRAVLDEYQGMIRATTQDLENHLEEINAKLRALAPLGGRPPTFTVEDRHWFERERQSTEQCLNICAQGLARLDELGLKNDDGTKTLMPAQHFTLAEIMTLLALRRCRDDLALHLRAKEEQVERYLPVGALHQEAADPASHDNARRLVSESHSTEQCLSVLHCAAERASSSGVHVVEDVDIGIDGQQMLITSRDQLFEAKRIKLGNRARQFVMSATSEELQQFFKSQRRA